MASVCRRLYSSVRRTRCAAPAPARVLRYVPGVGRRRRCGALRHRRSLAAPLRNSLSCARRAALTHSRGTPLRSIFRAPMYTRCAQARTTGAAKKIQELRLMTAIKTPYQPNGEIDLKAFDRHCEHQLANGVEALIIGGTTGEGHLFSWEEHIMLIAHTKYTFGDAVVVVGNTGSNSTNEVVHATKQGFAVGMDCSLQINPYYGKTSDSGIVKHIKAGMDFGPAIIYNVPGRTAQDIEPPMMEKLARHPNFVGVKECAGLERISQYTDAGMAVWSGNDDDMHEARHRCGARGSISVASNIVPGIYRDLLFGERNDELNDSLNPLFTWLFKEPNPIGVNTLLMQLDMAQPIFRLPYTHLDRAMREEGARIVEAIGIENIPNGDKLRVMNDPEFVHLAEW